MYLIGICSKLLSKMHLVQISLKDSVIAVQLLTLLCNKLLKNTSIEFIHNLFVYKNNLK